MGDNVEHPKHYIHGSHECVEFIRAALTDAEWAGYVKGNVMKYLWRANDKGGLEDIDKAMWYLSHYRYNIC